MKKVKTMGALAAAALLGGSILAGTVQAGSHGGGLSSESVAKMIEEASAKLKKADSVGGAWRDTGKMIKAAQKALDGGDLKEAAKLAGKAAKQGDLGYEQAVAQQVPFKAPSYLKY
jgi:hypothetical protein